MTRLLPLLLLSSCVSPSQLSPCGPTLVGHSDAWNSVSCDAISVLEPLFPSVREVSQRYTVVQSDFPAQHDSGGYTYCDLGTIELGSLGHDGALAHELRHALDCPAVNYSHAGWDADGSNEAIQKFHAEVMR